MGIKLLALRNGREVITHCMEIGGTVWAILFQAPDRACYPEGLILSEIYKSPVIVDAGSRFNPTRVKWVPTMAHFGLRGLRRCETLGVLSEPSHPVGHADPVHLLLGGLLGFRQRQRDRKGAPLAHDTLHRHLPAMRRHHLLHDI